MSGDIRLVRFDLLEVLFREGTKARRAELRLIITENAHLFGVAFVGTHDPVPGWVPMVMSAGQRIVDLKPEPAFDMGEKFHGLRNWVWNTVEPVEVECAVQLRLFAGSDAKVAHVVRPSFYALLGKP